jgi:putative DNA methylase
MSAHAVAKPKGESNRKMPAEQKKLIEVALPLEAINKAAKEEKSVPRHGHPQTLHYWWARRPLAAARAVLFAQMIDDPASDPDHFPTEEAQDAERQRLFRLIEEMVLWENTNNQLLLTRVRKEIWNMWRETCVRNQSHPRASELFNSQTLPTFHDPFSGGGTLPLEAQRLGLESYASDLNPVAVLISKALIEVPPRFFGQPPVNPEIRNDKRLFSQTWRAAQGLAADVRSYGQWMRKQAENRIGKLYPKVEITSELAKGRQDLKSLLGKRLEIIAWLWVRTVKSPNPAFTHVHVPLASTFMLSVKKGQQVWVEPVIEGDHYRFEVKVGVPEHPERAESGTKLPKGSNFLCLMSGTPITGDYIQAEGKAGRLGVRLIAVMAASDHGRAYLPGTSEMEAVAQDAKPEWKPDTEFFQQALGFRIGNYGLSKWSDLYTGRQLVALTTFSSLVKEALAKIKNDALAGGLDDDDRSLESGGTGARAYAEAVSIYLGCALSRLASYNNTFCLWNMKGGSVAQIFARQAISMTWDFIEVNPLEKMSGNWEGGIGWVSDVLDELTSDIPSRATQQDAASLNGCPTSVIFSTDPPYYDNIGYADLSDFFFVWLRPTLKSVLPELFATLTVPKDNELVATPYRHGGKDKAESFFLSGMTQAMHQLSERAHPAFPVTIYYAFKQSENETDEGRASTGWETFLDAVIRAGFAITGTWPIRTERVGGVRNAQRNSLASSIVLVCRRRAADAPTATRREFVTALKSELPAALAHLQHGNIAPVDLAQSAIGPGMAVYTRHDRVLDASGKPVPVREALALINQTLDEALAEQEGDFDSDSRWAVAWFEQFGFADGEYGIAETLSKAKNTSVSGMVEAEILASKGGKVRLLRPDELPRNWDPTRDTRLTAWEIVHQLISALERSGEGAASELVTRIGNRAEIGRELAYRLYTICERKKRAQEALSYNGLVQSWPEILRLSREGGAPPKTQTGLFQESEE